MSDLAYQFKKGYLDQASNDKFLSQLQTDTQRIQFLQDRQVIYSIPISSFNPTTQLPLINKQRSTLKNGYSNQPKIKSLKQIKQDKQATRQRNLLKNRSQSESKIKHLKEIVQQNKQTPKYVSISKARSQSEAKIKSLKNLQQERKSSNREFQIIKQFQGLKITNVGGINRQTTQSSEQSRKKLMMPMTVSRKRQDFTPFQKQKQLILDNTTAKSKANITKLSNNITLEEIQNQKAEILLNVKFGKIQENASYKAFLKREMNPSPSVIISKLNQWISQHKIKSGLIQTGNLEIIFRRISVPNNTILSQFTNYAELREEYFKKIPGLQFYDKRKPHRGPNLAALRIQSFFKMIIQRKKLRHGISLMKKVKIIQREWRIALQYRRTRQKIFNIQNKRIEAAKKLSLNFQSNWQLIRNTMHYELHICSYSLQEFKRLSIEKIREKQNAQLTRIFRALNPDKKIIFVTPYQLPPDVIRYYERLLQMNSPLSQVNNRIYFIDLEESIHVQFFQYLSTTSLLLYSPKAIKKIKSIINNQQQKMFDFPKAYILPCYPSCQYTNLSAQLNIPIFSFSQSLAKLYSSKLGFHQLFKQIVNEKTPFKLLKSVQNLYSQTEVINSLAVLIYKYKEVDRWYFKIDDQIEGRGLAIFTVNSLQLLRQLKKVGDSDETPSKQVIKVIAGQLTIKLKSKLKILRKDIYPDYNSYISNFVTRGGIIEASPINKPLQHSISFLIQPNGDFQILCTYSKLQLAGKPISSSIKCPSDVPIEEIDSQKIILHLYRYFWSKMKLYGYFSIDLLRDDKYQETYVIGLDCFLNSKTCSLSIPTLTSFAKFHKQTNTLQKKDPLSELEHTPQLHYLYYPVILIKNMPIMSKFFKNCKLNNVSFDLQKKLGTIFLMTGQIENGCVGFLTIESSLQSLLNETQRLVEFLDRQFRQNKRGLQQLGLMKGILVNWIRKIKKNKPQRQQINLSLIF